MQMLMRFTAAIGRLLAHPYAVAVPVLGWVLAAQLVWERYQDWRARA